jgi:molybdopterin-guanine dinucleotide biosynthesis protein B
MKIFTITGWSGSGKTTLITQLIKYFKERGKRIVAVKNAPHKYYLEPESKDTFKFLEAGSDEVCLVAKNEILRMNSLDHTTDIFELLISSYKGYDLILLEGLHKDNIPKIEVLDSSKHQKPKNKLEGLAAIVSDQNHEGQIPVFGPTEINKIASFMEVYDD